MHAYTMLLYNILNLWKIHEQLSIIIICLHTQNENFGQIA